MSELVSERASCVHQPSAAESRAQRRSLVFGGPPHLKKRELTYSKMLLARRSTVTTVLDEATLLQVYQAEIRTLKGELEKMGEAAKEKERDQMKIYEQMQMMSPQAGGGAGEEEEFAEDEEEIQAIETAIHNLERLVLKSEGGGGGIKKLVDSKVDDGGNDNLFFRRKSDQANIVSRHPKPNKLPPSSRLSPEAEIHVPTETKPIEVQIQSPPQSRPPRSATPESSAGGVGESNAAFSLVNELQRVQEMLGEVLEKKNNRRSTISTPMAERSGGMVTPQRLPPHSELIGHTQNQNQNQNQDTWDMNESRLTATNNELVATIKNLETEKKLKRADLNFLEQQITEKDMVLNDVSLVLDAVEKHQGELEKENEMIRGENETLSFELDELRMEVMELKRRTEGEVEVEVF